MKKQHIYLLLAAALLTAITRAAVNEQKAHVAPKVQKENICVLLAQDAFSENDYRTLLAQTGLGKAAIDDLKTNNASFAEDILEFQEQYFAPVQYQSERMFFMAREECLTYENGNEKSLRLAPVRDGDIILTRSTHTALWRHGHAAIVTNAQEEQTLESVMLGQKSSFQTLEKWRGYPNVIILRAKEKSTAEAAAKYAREHMAGIDYSPFVGIKAKDKQGKAIMDSTQCAHLVWQAFRAAGIDIDANGGWLVLPRDIANSSELEIVQIYGFLPQKPLW